MKPTMTTAQFREEQEREMTEAQFQQWVIEEAHLGGWRVAWFRPVRVQRANGTVYHETPVGADGKGWPDLVLCRERILFVELKAANGILKPDQKEWLKAILRGGGEHLVWRPADRANITRILGRKP